LANPALSSALLHHARGRAALIAPRFPSQGAVLLRTAGIALVPMSEVVVVKPGGSHLDDTTIVRLIRGGPARLEVRQTEKVVLIDGTPQPVPSRPFELLLPIVKHACGGPPMKSAKFEMEWRRAPADVMRELKKALSKGRLNTSEIESWFVRQSVTGGYVLTLDPTQVDLLP
jgi:hypothetical protein